MTPEAWFTLGTIALVILVLMTNRVSADVAMIGGLTLLMIGDFVFGRIFGSEIAILPVPEAIGGFAHPAVMMIGALFVVAAGLQETGGMEFVAQKLLGRPKTVARAQFRLMAPVALMSAFMNNTPIVQMYLPIVNDWARKLKISPSKLYMPLSFSAILGGKCSLIGTASNITIMLLYLEYLKDSPPWVDALGVGAPSHGLHFWGVAAVGVPTTIAGIAIIMLTSKWLLPERKPALPTIPDARRYEVEMEVRPDAPIAGKTIEEAGLRQLPGLYLHQIERDGDILPAVAPDERLQSGDRLAFAGILESVVDLQRIRGLVPATDQVEKVAADRRSRTLVEAVVSHESPLVNRTVRDSRFRTVYNAAIIAVHRNGQRVRKKIGDIELQAGDTLLLDTHAGFVIAYRNSEDFYLVSTVEGTRPVRHERAWLALAILAVMVLFLAASPVPEVLVAFTCALAMVGTRCVIGSVARSAINWQVLIVIAASLGMGRALDNTGAAKTIADGMMAMCANIGVAENPYVLLFVLFVMAATFSQLITNNGAAVLVFPIAMETAHGLGGPGVTGVNPLPFVFMLMVAAGSSFLSPVAYQTNLMVYGPGGYRFMDYVRLGLPVTIAVAVITTLLAPLFFPFVPA